MVYPKCQAKTCEHFKKHEKDKKKKPIAVTVNMKPICSKEMFDEAVDHLVYVLTQACEVTEGNDTHYDSMALSSYADALVYLEKIGRVKIRMHAGRRVLAVNI
jgi:hypothetical protein